MATGKTNPRWTRMLVDGVDLSGDYRDVGDLGMTFSEDDATGATDNVENSTLGIAQLIFGPLNAIFSNWSESGGDSRDGSFTHLKTVSDRVVSVLIGVGAAPANGDECFCSPIQQSSFTVAPGAGTVTISMDGNTPGHTETAPENVWGKVFAYVQSIATGTTNTSSIDNAASSANGGATYFHVTEATDTPGTLIVEHSANDSTWATLATSSLDGTAEGGDQVVVSGTVDRYTRATVTNNGTPAIEATISLVRY